MLAYVLGNSAGSLIPAHQESLSSATPGWGLIMSNDGLNYDEIRARAEKRVKKRAEFLQHLAIYAIVNGFLWLMFLVIAVTTGAWPALIAPFLSTVGWGIGLAIHALTVYVDTNAVEKIRQQEIDREIQREMERRGMPGLPERHEKPKRDQVMRLSDDGELIPDDTDEEQEPPRARRRQR